MNDKLKNSKKHKRIGVLVVRFDALVRCFLWWEIGMAKWITIYSNRTWRNTRTIDEEKILQVVDWGVQGIEIIYPSGLFKKTYFLKRDKDGDEYKYFESLATRNT